MTTIAFLGLGNMGGPMSGNLVDAGHTVRGFDPVPAARQAAADHGVTVLESASAAVQGADVVVTMLPNGALVRQCYADVMPAAAKGALFIDSSTIAVDDARSANAYAAERGSTLIAAGTHGATGWRRIARDVRGGGRRAAVRGASGGDRAL
jgi:3-hydroxyisobutyrate dehydrogenase